MTSVPVLDEVDAAHPLRKRGEQDHAAAPENERRWRNWLITLLSCLLIGTALLYTAVVVIDPFSTGRFALTRRIDFATSNPRMAKPGLVRDRRFDGALFGDSTGFPLDPANIAATTQWRMAQLTFPGSTPADILTVARTFARDHRGRRTLAVFMLSGRWCKDIGPSEESFGPFPTWLYESTNAEYLSRIFFPEAVEGAAMRVAIWLGVAEQMARADGYAPVVPRREPGLALVARPDDGPSPDAPFPSIDALAAYVATLPADSAIGFVLSPPYLNVLPRDSSVAAARLEACKQRVRRIAAQRRYAGYLDLMTENSITQDIDNYQDGWHYNLRGARLIEPWIADMIKQIDLPRQ